MNVFRTSATPNLHRTAGDDEVIIHVERFFPNLTGALKQLLERLKNPGVDASNRIEDRFCAARVKATGCCPNCGTVLEVEKSSS